MSEGHEEEPLYVHVDAAHVRRQGIGDEHLDSVPLNDMVVPRVSPADVGVDRHLTYAGRSGGHADDVQDGLSPLTLNPREGLLTETHVHFFHVCPLRRLSPDGAAKAPIRF